MQFTRLSKALLTSCTAPHSLCTPLDRFRASAWGAKAGAPLVSRSQLACDAAQQLAERRVSGTGAKCRDRITALGRRELLGVGLGKLSAHPTHKLARVLDLFEFGQRFLGGERFHPIDGGGKSRAGHLRPRDRIC